MGPTAAAATLGYQGGYLANTLSSRNIMGQVGGMSALTGASNEQVAGAFAGINAMSFLRAGIRARDRQGNLVAPNQLVNQAYGFLYGGRKITKEQAMMVLNPGSKGYATLMQLSGGNPELLQQLQMGIIARASKGSSLTKKDLSDPNRALDIMGVGKESPLRAQFRYNASEARKLQATEEGLVGGYNVSLRTTASVNDAFSTMADILGPVNDGLMTLKGILQTLPGAGNTGATLSGLGSMAAGAAGSALQLGLTARLLGVGGKAGFMGTGAMAAGGVSAGTAAAGATAATATGAAALTKRAALLKLLKSSKGKLTLGSIAAVLGAEGLDALFGEKVSPGVRKAGLAAANIGGMALTGAAIGSFIPVIGTGIGAAIGTAIGVGQTLAGMGGDGGGCNHGNMGCSHGIGGDNDGASAQYGKVFQPPVKPGTRISSDYGPRPEAARRNPGISSNHRGIDYAVAVGSPVQAAADGIVYETGSHPQYGFYVIIKHEVKSTLYAHLSEILVQKGQRVKRGQVIAKSGGKKGARGAGSSTGPHLHFEVRNHGGVGAQGRENPKGFFGKAFSFIKAVGTKIVSGLKSMAGAVVNRFKGHEGTNKDREFDYDSPIGTRLSSPTISQLLNMFGKYGPVNYDRLVSGINQNDRRYKDVLDPGMTKGNGGEQGIAGGSRAGFMQMLYSAGFRGDALKTAFAVAMAESGGRINAIGDEDLVTKKWGPSYGPFQIRSLRNWKAYEDPWRNAVALRDPKFNIAAAFEKSKGGKNWKPWSAYNNGSFLKWMDDANRVATSSGIGGGPDTMGNSTSSGIATEGSSVVVQRSGGANFNASSKIDVKVNMNVNIARASVAEANKLADDVLKRLESKIKYGEGLGIY
jgi:murein DD-endopeptidase MepM/ murein hydrolase activator NlpD